MEKVWNTALFSRDLEALDRIESSAGSPFNCLASLRGSMYRFGSHEEVFRTEKCGLLSLFRVDIL